jgi:carbon-monoxide dehydrogenase medium subunit
VRVPKLAASTGWSYVKGATAGLRDWATVWCRCARSHRDIGSVAGAVDRSRQQWARHRSARRPPRDALAGGASVSDAAALAAEGAEPPADLAGSSEYRAHLARVITTASTRRGARALGT